MDYRDNRQRWAESHQVVHFYAGQWCTFTPALTRSLCDGAIDTTTASGELVFNIFSSLAQFERRLIQERTRAGLAAARARGRTGGRRSIRSDDPRVLMAKRMHEDKDMKIG